MTLIFIIVLHIITKSESVGTISIISQNGKLLFEISTGIHGNEWVSVMKSVPQSGLPRQYSGGSPLVNKELRSFVSTSQYSLLPFLFAVTRAMRTNSPARGCRRGSV